MAAITFETARVAATHPRNSEIFDGIPAVDLEPGDIITFNTAGRLVLAGANTANIRAAKGVVLTKASAGKGCSYLVRGPVAGFNVGSLNAGAAIYLSDTAGDLGDAAGTTSVLVGSVLPIAEGNSPVKVAYFDFNMAVAVS